MLSACVDETTSDMHSQQTSAVTLFIMLQQGPVLFSCIAVPFVWAAEGNAQAFGCAAA